MGDDILPQVPGRRRRFLPGDVLPLTDAGVDVICPGGGEAPLSLFGLVVWSSVGFKAEDGFVSFVVDRIFPIFVDLLPFLAGSSISLVKAASKIHRRLSDARFLVSLVGFGEEAGGCAKRRGPKTVHEAGDEVVVLTTDVVVLSSPLLYGEFYGQGDDKLSAMEGSGCRGNDA
uniref:Uncharacterized protein n=1 Tax=Leersia perrieri TaxID=77586 RepID=A0A0D9Y0I3_9ORYZ